MCLAALRKLNYIHGESTSVREEMIHYQLFVKIGLFTTRLATFYDTLPAACNEPYLELMILQ